MGANKQSAVQVGLKFTTNRCGVLEIIETYAKKAKVRFLDTGYERLANKADILRGKVNDPFFKSFHGIGYLGVGLYSPKNSRNNYKRWVDMLDRCYNIDNPMYLYYEYCYVVDEWHNFQNYMDWAVTQSGFDKKGWQIDKDLFSNGDPCYGPETCVFLPKDINMALITHRKWDRDLNTGVSYHEKNKKYIARATQSAKHKNTNYIGSYNTPEEAYSAYKEYKKKFLMFLAEKFKDDLTERAYEGLRAWVVT